MAQTMQRAQSFARYLMQIVVAQAEILKVFWNIIITKYKFTRWWAKTVYFLIILIYNYTG